MTNGDTATKVVRKVRRFFGHFPQVTTNLERIEELFEYRCVDEEPEHIMLLGDPGTGKSTLLKSVVRKHPRIEHDEFTEVPVLYAQVPPSCTIKKLAGAMLLALGSPFWNKGTEQERSTQLGMLISACRVRLIILDEVNHVVDHGQFKSHESVADWIKHFSTQVCVSLVLAGIGRSRLLLSANGQFADRFREVLQIEPLGVGDESQLDESYRVMEAFEVPLDGVAHIDLKSTDMMTKFAFASAGRLRNIRRLLVRGVELASREPDFFISEAILEKAFKQVIFKKATPEQNPFSPKFRGTPLTLSGEPFAPTAREMEEV